MKKTAFSVILFLFVALGDVPLFSQPENEDLYRQYNEYRESLLDLQEEAATVTLEVKQNPNSQVVYNHLLRIVEKTGILIGKAELASQNAFEGFQGSLKGRLEILLEFGFSENQRADLLALGYTEEDLTELMRALAYYNDDYYHAANGFTEEERAWLHSLGLTDSDMAKIQASMKDTYEEIHRMREEIKKQQSDLLYIQLSLSAAALRCLMDTKVEAEKKAGDPRSLEPAEEKLLKAIQEVSTDQSSLERVKACAKQVYKAAEQRIRTGETQYSLDFLIGLQVHCGALTALYGDPEFGTHEIAVYEAVLSDCITSERSLPLISPGEQSSAAKVTPLPEFQGDIEETDEENNTGALVLIVKPRGDRWIRIGKAISLEVLGHAALEVLKRILMWIVESLVTVISYTFAIVGVIISLILNASPVGGSWVDCVVDCMTTDPSGTFAKIFETEETELTIEGKTKSGTPCERSGFYQVYTDPIQIVYTIMGVLRVYRSPNGHYFYYGEDYTNAWVVEVEVWGAYSTGRVVEAFRVDCSYECNKTDCPIYEKWVLYDNFTLIWER
ncbi:MAG: hypothetical protein HXS42_13615 [Theionarchaea archaeon]|nr:hypothetical protein [Theionarchaea archaeon]